MARDAREALARAETLEPDVALVDIGMPGMDGHELARRLRAQPRYRNALLVAVTGYGRAEDRDAARRAGFNAFLVTRQTAPSWRSCSPTHVRVKARGVTDHYGGSRAE